MRPMRKYAGAVLLLALGACTCGEEICDTPECAALPDAGPKPPADPNDPANAFKDTDCDLVSDADEFALSFGGRKLDPDKADTDGDGVPDGVELGRTVRIAATCADTGGDSDPRTSTDPTVADSDGDGLGDGEEDADHDGRADPGESDPTKLDGDCDGIADPDERSGSAGCATDPLSPDADGDGIPDGVEAGLTTAADADGCSGVALDAEPATRTNPCSSDTDTDGILDGAEDLNKNGKVDPGELDPRNSFDGTGPAQSACSSANLRVVRFPRSSPADVQLALVPDFGEARSFTSGGVERGFVFYDGTHQIAGAAIAKTPVGATASDEESAARILLGAVGTISNPITQTFVTWDGVPAVRASYDVAGGADLKDRLAALVRAFYPNAQNLLTGSAGAAGPFRLQAQFVRRSAARAVLLFALTPSSSAAVNVYRSDDVAGGSALAQDGDTNAVQCEVFQFTGSGAVDFLWVVDDSGSMAASQGAVASAGSKMIQRLQNSTLDWRMGAVTTDYYRSNGTNISTFANRPFIPKSNGSASAIVNAWFTENNSCLTCNSPCFDDTSPPLRPLCGATVCGTGNCRNSGTPCNQGCWFGTGGNGTEKALFSVRRYIQNVLLPASSASTPPANKLRAGAKLQIILLGDADDQSATGDIGGSTDYIGVYTRFLQNYDGASSSATTHGIVCPLGANCNDETQKTPRLNVAVIQNTGGVLGDILIAQDGTTDPLKAAQFDSTIDAIVGAAIGSAGQSLQKPPIAATLKVASETGGTIGACNTADIPRDRSNGFDFDSVTRRISFFGNCRPTAGRTIAVSYRYWIDQSSIPDGGVGPPPCNPDESCYVPGDGGPPDAGPGVDAGPDAGACIDQGDSCDLGAGARCCTGFFCDVSGSDGGTIGVCNPFG